MSTISENTQTDFDNAEAIVMDMLQTNHPGISLHRGTVLRELLVRPVAEVYAADTRRVEDSMASRSLELMKESGIATAEEVDAILSNFSTYLYKGKNASGYLFVQVSDKSVYSILPDVTFTSPDGLVFNVKRGYIATAAAVSGDEYLPLKQNSEGIYYFLLPVEASEVGSKYEVDAGIRFSISEPFNGFVAATSYAKFSGGVDAQTLSDAIDTLESAVSLRGMGSRVAIQSTLLDRNAGNFAGQVLASSIVGYGDREQIRDKANVFGIATGGKVDLFVRTFSTPTTLSFTKTGTWDLTKKAYVVEFDASEVPGYYGLKSVVDAGSVPVSDTSGKNSLLSYDSYITEEQFEDVSEHPLHVLKPDGLGSAYSVFRNVLLYVYPYTATTQNCPEDIMASKDFSISVYAYPIVAAVQDYIDRDDVRSIRDDVLVRTAPICFIKIRASVGIKPGHKIPDLYNMRTAVAEYINSRSFVPRLTASEIVAVLNQFDISRVEMMFGHKYGFQMTGRVRSASGKIIDFQGPDIDIEAHAAPEDLISEKTVCFATNVEDIEINVISDR